jgi:hypothetical protein
MTADHVARASRRWRRGAWQPVAECPCGWTEPAETDYAARGKAIRHNREERAGRCEAITYPKKWAVRWPFGAFCARCHWIGEARTEPEAQALAEAHNTGKAA